MVRWKMRWKGGFVWAVILRKERAEIKGVSNLALGHNISVETERLRLWIQLAKMSFLCGVSVLTGCSDNQKKIVVD